MDKRGWWDEPWKICVQDQQINERLGVTWSPPGILKLKLNVDGPTYCKSGSAGCAGVLSDYNGHVRGVFYGPLGVKSSNYAKLMAIFYALKFFASTPWAGSHKLVVELDSQGALSYSWVEKTTPRPWAMWQVFTFISQPLLILRLSIILGRQTQWRAL